MIINLRGIILTGAVPTDGTPALQPFTQPFAIPKGAEGSIVVTVVNELGAAVDITGATGIYFTARRFATDPAPSIHIAGALTTPVTGVVTFPITNADTALLEQDIYRGDVWLTLAAKKNQVVPGSNVTIGEAVGP